MATLKELKTARAAAASTLVRLRQEEAEAIALGLSVRPVRDHSARLERRGAVRELREYTADLEYRRRALHHEVAQTRLARELDEDRATIEGWRR